MAQARTELVDLESTVHYHCSTRCVRQAFLCGTDKHTKKNFDHRKAWVVTRLHALAAIFAIDICAYAVMSNHLHIVLRIALERALAWSDDEVVERYGSLFPMAKRNWDASTPKAQRELTAVWRGRLSDMSWLMRALNEWIARRANKEDGCKGRFWESRFSSQPLLDDTALLTCMAYVDLNPVRVGAKKLDQGTTSIKERLMLAARNLAAKTTETPDVLASTPRALAPFADASSNSPIPMNLADYIALLEWTGRCTREDGPSGVLEGPLPAILVGFGVNPEEWLRAMAKNGLRNRCALGRVERLEAHARKRGKRRVHNKKFARALFG